MIMVKNNVITGENGFLMQNLMKNDTFSTINDCIIHFGSPSCINEFSKESTLQMINDVKALLMLPHKNFIFASSMGVVRSSDNKYQQMYNDAKKRCEKLIKNSGKNYIILRIPRVYGVDRNKGLIQDLKENKVPIMDYIKLIKYMKIEDFVHETKVLINTNINVNNSIIHYKNLSINSIYKIKKIYTKG